MILLLWIALLREWAEPIHRKSGEIRRLADKERRGSGILPLENPGKGSAAWPKPHPWRNQKATVLLQLESGTLPHGTLKNPNSPQPSPPYQRAPILDTGPFLVMNGIF